MSQPLTDALNALITYSNSVTGASDTTVSECVATLVAGYSGGSGGSMSYTPIPSKPLTSSIESLTAYANSVTGASDETLSEAIATLANGYSAKSWTDYVQDGLEVLWDGIQNTRNGHVATPTAWENLAGSSFDIANSNVTFENNCAVFDGANYFHTGYSEKAYQTVEFVIMTPSDNSGGVVIKTSKSNKNTGFAVITGSSTNYYRFIGRRGSTNGGYKDVPMSIDAKASYSGLWHDTGTTIDIYKNGVLAEGNYGTNNWGYGTGYIVGAYDRYNPPRQYFYKGRIYCIRLYTRTLTEAEVLQNYAVDKARFGL